ncbi:MAG TPA: hypothetical protein VGK30_12535 [Candidatus Binatia bacterium]
MTDLADSDADDSLAAVIQRCELQIAALAGRLDAESGRRSAVTREISATVESQLLAVRSTVQGLAVLRAAVEDIGEELEDLGQHRAVTESHATVLDARVTTIARGVETQVAEAEQKVAQLQGAIQALRTELEAVRAAAPLPPEESGTAAAEEREPREDAAGRAEIESLRAALTDASVELARLGTSLARVEHGLGETRAEVERSLTEASAGREALQALADGLRDDVAALRADVAMTVEAERAARAETEATVALLRADVASTRGRLDDASRAMDGMHGTLTAVGGDIGALQEAAEATLRDSSAVRAAVSALRGESEERLTAATDEIRTEIAGVRDATSRLEGEIGSVRVTVGRLDDEIGGVRGAVGQLDGKVEDVRGMVARLDGEIGAVRGAGEDVREEVHALRGEVSRASEELDAARGLIAILRDEGLAGERAVETLRQQLDGVHEETQVATGALAAARDEMDLVHAGLERTQQETRTLRDEVASLRHVGGSAAVVAPAGPPEGLRELTDAVEALRSGLARQDALVDARITTSHRATETLRGELTEMRTQMQEMLTLMRERAAQPAPSDEPLVALLETLGAQVASLRALAERMPGGRLLWAVMFPAPVLSVATALARRFAPRPG